MYHGEDKIAIAEERYNQVANGCIPEDIKKFKIKNDEEDGQNGKEINICDLLVKVGFATSKSAAKRMVIGRGVKLDGETIENINHTIAKPEGKVLQFGKNKFIKLV